MLSSATSVFAQKTLMWQGTMNELDIASEVSLLEDTSMQLSFQQVAAGEMQGSFEKWDKPLITLGYTTSAWWLKFELENNSSKDLNLEISQAGLPDCDFYCQISPDSLVHYQAGGNHPFKNRVIKSSFQVFPLLKGKHTYYVRLTSNSGPIPIKIIEEHTYEEKSISLKLVYGAYIGLMLFVLLSNLFFFFSLRNFLYLVNSLNVLIFTAYSALVVDFFGVYFFDSEDIMFWYTNIPSIGVTIQTIYSLWFLEVKKYRPKINTAVWWLVGVYVLWFVFKGFLPFAISQPINTLQALLSFFVMGFVGIRVWQKGNRFGLYFALTYFIYFILVLAEAVYINTGKPEYILGFSYSGHATVIEALALSFLLTKRFEWEKEELNEAKQLAQAQLVEATLENERFVREQNVVLEQKVAERTEQLSAEKKKSDDLLHNILPEEVADELKRTGQSEAKQFKQVTVLFTDFTHFTETTQQLIAKALVEELNICFKKFDEIVDKYGIEKIKTIGDSYMAAGGLHAGASVPLHVVSAGLEMQDFMLARAAARNPKGLPVFDMRVGIHTGPVVAGIVGVKKFQYDIWGDTVNTASRMESYGQEGKVNISTETYELVKDEPDFTFVSRGIQDVKGKGNIAMWFVSWAKKQNES